MAVREAEISSTASCPSSSEETSAPSALRTSSETPVLPADDPAAAGERGDVSPLSPAVAGSSSVSTRLDELALLDHLFYPDGTSKALDQFILNVRFHNLQHRIAVWPQTTMSALRLLLEEPTLVQKYRPDVIYLDSAHLRDETLLELVLAWRVLAPGGILFGDDWVLDEVREDVGGILFGVRRRLGAGRSPGRCREEVRLCRSVFSRVL